MRLSYESELALINVNTLIMLTTGLDCDGAREFTDYALGQIRESLKENKTTEERGKILEEILGLDSRYLWIFESEAEK